MKWQVGQDCYRFLVKESRNPLLILLFIGHQVAPFILSLLNTKITKNIESKWKKEFLKEV